MSKLELNNRYVLFQISKTQRISITPLKDGVLINKDWRKDENDDWVIGKGVTLNNKAIRNLNEITACKSEKELEQVLSKYKSANGVKMYEQTTAHGNKPYINY